MRGTGALVTVALVLVAGCAGLVPGDDESPTSGAIVRGTPESPPGVDEVRGVTNATALLDAHRRALTDGGFVLSTTTTVRPPDAPAVVVDHRVHAAAGLERYRHASTRRVGGRTVVERRWAGPDGTARRVLDNGTVAARGSYDRVGANRLTRTPRLRWFLHRGAFDVTSVSVRRTGTRYLLESDGPLDGEGHLSVRLLVTGEGRVESLTATATRPGDDGGRTVESYEYRLVRAGDVTVTPPSWVDEEGER